jgi:high affinity sulfate transporter 1
LVTRLLPGLAVLAHYRRAWLSVDVVGGLTVGAMLIPQSMAYAELGGLPPEAGFYAAMGALVVYALVGTSRHLGVGPEPGTAILAATGVGAIAGGDPARYASLMAALALVTAALCVGGALLRLGFVASFLSKPVLVGYITGVGLTLLSSQLGPMSGVSIESDHLVPRVAEFVRELDDIDMPTLLVGIGTLALVLLLRRVAPRLPGALIGVVAATLFVAAFDLDENGVALIGTIPYGLPAPQWPEVSFADVGELLPVAAGIALVGFTDNLLTARAVAERGRDHIDANQELLALGLTNFASGVSQGFPVSSSASRSAVAASLRTQTQMVSLVACGFVVAALLLLHPLLSEIPRAALAAVIVVAGIAIIDVAGFRTLWRVSRPEVVTAVAAALGVVVFDVLIGVLVAIITSGLLALYRVARPHDAVLGDHPSLDGWVDADAYPEAATESGLLVYRFDAPLFFVNADYFCQRVQRVLADNPGSEEWLVLDFEGVGSLDATALDSVAELLELVASDGVAVVGVARANDKVLARLGAGGLLAPDGPLRVFPTINSAVHAFRSRPLQ